MSFTAVLRPNQQVSRGQARLLGAAWLTSFLALWGLHSFAVLPSPRDVVLAVPALLREQGLLGHLAASLYTNLSALAWSGVLGVLLAYASVVPALAPATRFTAKLRFLGFAGVGVALTLWLEGGHALKVALMTFGMLGFIVTAELDEIGAIPRERYDYARSLGFSEWRVVWEVVVLGTLDRTLDVLRQNAAMGWMLLTTVEVLVRSEGGLGVLLANQSKHMDLAKIAALQGMIFGIGVLQDRALAAFKRLICPHAALQQETVS